MADIVFRADASLQIGTGHVMRCVTLASALRERGADVLFVTRELPGNMIAHLKSKGFPIRTLPSPRGPTPQCPPPHAAWAGVDWQRDAVETAAELGATPPKWLVVDHYAFDERWEKAVRQGQMNLMAIDDLADRPHDCELLLDQNLGRKASDYTRIVPNNCSLMIGPQYALLRPEFPAKRTESIRRRENPEMKHVLVALGGVDQDNVTANVLQKLQELAPPPGFRVTVALGGSAPWLDQIKRLSNKATIDIAVLPGVENMASLMSQADLAIGAAGSSSWERCCLGLPTLLIVLAENQIPAARALVKARAAEVICSNQRLGLDLDRFFSRRNIMTRLRSMSKAATTLVDGLGTLRVCERMEALR